MSSRFTRDAEQEYDVVIVGGMAAVSAGAVLANEGHRVAIVYEHEELGGRYGSTNYNGYWIPGDSVTATTSPTSVSARRPPPKRPDGPTWT